MMKRRAKVDEAPEFREGKPKAAGSPFNRIFVSEPEIKEWRVKVETPLGIDNGWNAFARHVGTKGAEVDPLLRAYDEKASQSGVT